MILKRCSRTAQRDYSVAAIYLPQQEINVRRSSQSFSSLRTGPFYYCSLSLGLLAIGLVRVCVCVFVLCLFCVFCVFLFANGTEFIGGTQRGRGRHHTRGEGEARKGKTTKQQMWAFWVLLARSRGKRPSPIH